MLILKTHISHKTHFSLFSSSLLSPLFPTKAVTETAARLHRSRAELPVVVVFL